jgi:hypothetical protein
MKMRAVLAFMAVLNFFQPLNSKADDLFQMFWRGTYYKTNSTGRMVAVKFSESDFVNKVARDNNLRPSDLVFVYRPNKRDTAVVRASNGAFVADVIQMEMQYTDVVNRSGKVIVRHAFLFDEYHDTALGSFMGIETRSFKPSGALAWDTLTGTILYSKPDEGKVYSGSVSTGRRIVDKTGAP